MKKEDLKTGMLVQLRNGDVGLLINETIVFLDISFVDLKDYNSDLTHCNSKYLDMVKVSNILRGSYLLPLYWTEETLNANLIWERKEIKPLTGFEILEKYLTKDEQLEFYKEFEKWRTYKSRGLHEYFECHEDMILEAFNWEKTEKGGDYWCDIYTRI